MNNWNFIKTAFKSTMKPIFFKDILRVMTLNFLVFVSMFSYAQTTVQDPRLKALAPWTAQGEVNVVEVPAASNAFSNMLLVASLKSGSGSQAVERIVSLLRIGPKPSLAVIGQKPSVTEATVLSALKDRAKSLVKPAAETPNVENSATIILVGSVEDEKVLRDAAIAAGVRLEIVPIP